MLRLTVSVFSLTLGFWIVQNIAHGQTGSPITTLNLNELVSYHLSNLPLAIDVGKRAKFLIAHTYIFFWSDGLMIALLIS
jgi:hypothetical protein